jgi:hypothetical protein
LLIAATARADRDPHAKWADGVELTWIDRDDGDPVSIQLHVPHFRSRPKAIAKEMNAVFAAGLHPGTFPKMRGTYLYDCAVSLLSRRAMSVKCGKMIDVAPEAAQGGMDDDAPAGPTPEVTTVWLQPGLPKITIDELADASHVQAALAAATASCEFRADSFVVDTNGVTFEPIDYCPADTDLPTIALDDLRANDAWAKLLLAWLHERVDAGDGAIVGE